MAESYFHQKLRALVTCRVSVNTGVVGPYEGTLMSVEIDYIWLSRANDVPTYIPISRICAITELDT